MQTTKLYENVTDNDIDMVGIGIVAAHDRLTVSSQYPTPVNLANYPGVIDVSDMDQPTHDAAVQAAQQTWLAANPGKSITGQIQSTAPGGNAYPDQNTAAAGLLQPPASPVPSITDQSIGGGQ